MLGLLYLWSGPRVGRLWCKPSPVDVTLFDSIALSRCCEGRLTGISTSDSPSQQRVDTSRFVLYAISASATTVSLRHLFPPCAPFPFSHDATASETHTRLTNFSGQGEVVYDQVQSQASTPEPSFLLRTLTQQQETSNNCSRSLFREQISRASRRRVEQRRGSIHAGGRVLALRRPQHLRLVQEDLVGVLRKAQLAVRR